MAAPCPLCHTPCVFPGPAPLLAALDSLARGPILCPLPLCGHTAASLDSLILHLASCHSDNIAVSLQHPLLSDNNPVFQQKQQQQLESDNIEQVIKDLEDLVESEIELKPQLSAGPCVITGLAPDIVTQPLPTWSCPTPDSGRGSQMQSPQGSNISLPGPGYQSLLSELPGQSCQLNSINHQGMSNQVSTPSLSSLMIAPPPPPPAPAHAAWLPQGQYPGPEAGPLYSDHTQPQLRGKLVSQMGCRSRHTHLIKMLKCSHCVSDGPGSRPARCLTSAQESALHQTRGLRGWGSQRLRVIGASGVRPVRLDVRQRELPPSAQGPDALEKTEDGGRGQGSGDRGDDLVAV